jgi:Zn ribbon nucleic-acid-binding protein
MLVRHYSQGKWYRIACPEGSRIERRSVQAGGGGAYTQDRLIVPWAGEEIAIPAEPVELLPMLAESGRCGLSLVGDPQPDVRLAGVACPDCGEGDENWLVLQDGEERVHCDSCGADFDLKSEEIEAPASGDLDPRIGTLRPRRL